MRSADAVSGVQAGLLSGTFVAVSFFVGDLINLAPLSTPLALIRKFSPREIPQDGRKWASLDLRLLVSRSLRGSRWAAVFSPSRSCTFWSSPCWRWPRSPSSTGTTCP